MRIVLVGTAYPLRGGIAHYVALLYDTLRRRGHTVAVLSFKRQYPSLLFPGKTQKDEGRELLPVRAYPILDSINPLTWLLALAWLKRFRPDLAVFKYWMPFFAPCYAALAAGLKALGVPTVFLCDNVVPHEKKAGDAVLTRLAFRFPDACVVQSASVRDDLLRVKPVARFREVPHPVYSLFPPPMPKVEARRALEMSDTPVLLFFGYIRPYKGLNVLLNAMPEILRAVHLRLLVCGEFYEGRQESVDLIHRLGLQHAIALHDTFIPNEKVAQFFCAADVVVLPYLAATQSGIVQIAYHYDRPVIATAVGGLPETVRHGKTGFIVPPNDPEALARAVVRFYAEKKMRAFEQAIRIEKKNYSWDRMGIALEELALELRPSVSRTS
jgi:glycosyltransferase involved in cell wall biosynthesis